MSGLTFGDLALSEDRVKELLDDPAVKFLKLTTITAMMKRSYNLINFQIDINVGNQDLVKDAIYAMSAWYSFGAYGQSISSALQLQDIGAFRANLEHYKEVAEQFAGLIGVDLNKETEPVYDDPIPIIDSGNSFIDMT